MKTTVDPYVSTDRAKTLKEAIYASRELRDLAWNTCQRFIELLPSGLSLFGEIIKATFVEVIGQKRFSQQTETFIDIQFQIVIKIDPAVELAVRWDSWRRVIHIGRIVGNGHFESEERMSFEEVQYVKGQDKAEIRARILIICVKNKLRRYISESRIEIEKKLSKLKELEEFADGVIE